MGLPRRSLLSDSGRGFPGADEANFASAALPLLLATMGLTLLAVGLILPMPVMALGGSGLVVVGAGAYFIAAAMDRADRRSEATRRAEREARMVGKGQATRHRGPLADAAVAALTQPGDGGIWPPLSTGRGRSAPQGAQARGPGQPEGAQAVSMWEPYSKVAPPAFQDEEAGGEEEDLVEFTAVGPDGEQVLHAAAPARAAPRPAQMATFHPPEDGERDHRVWPGARDLGHWRHMTGERTRAEERTDEERRAANDERRARLAARLPTVGAILAEGAHATEPPKGGSTRGKCSRCNRFIWAPPQRPVTLKCPGCNHKARLY